MREFQEAIAVFDLDRTITRFGTFSPFLFFSCATMPWRVLYSVPILFWMFQYKMGWMSRERLKERMLLVLAGRKREALLKMHHISGTVEYTGFADLDLVVEAVIENLDIKRKVFGQLEAVMATDAVLASNTSTLSIDDMS